MKNGILEKWNGTTWEAVPSKSGQTYIFEKFGIGFAVSRDSAVNYFEEELDWELNYGALSEGDYRICQTIESVIGRNCRRMKKQHWNAVKLRWIHWFQVTAILLFSLKLPLTGTYILQSG